MSDELNQDISILKQTRMTKGYSLDMVHEATKIPLDVLRALEEGYKVRTLTPFYYKAFLRTYAKYLGIDPQTAIEEFTEIEEKKGVRLTKAKPKKEFTPPKSKLDHKIEEYWTPQRKEFAVRIAIGVVVLFVGIKLVWFVGATAVRWVSSMKTKTESKQLLVQDQKKTEEVVKKPQATKASSSKVPEQKAPSTQSPVANVRQANPRDPIVVSKSVVVTVRTPVKTFLFVQADGNTVFQSSLGKGAVETWSAENEVIISGKNVGQLEYEVNGKLLGPLSRRDSKASKIVITKDGITVSKR